MNIFWPLGDWAEFWRTYDVVIVQFGSLVLLGIRSCIIANLTNLVQMSTRIHIPDNEEVS